MVTECEPPGRIVLWVDGSKGSTGKGEYRFTHQLTPSDDGAATTVRMDAEIEIPGMFFKLLGKVFLGSFRKAIEKDNAAMKRYLESGEALPTPS